MYKGIAQLCEMKQLFHCDSLCSPSAIKGQETKFLTPLTCQAMSLPVVLRIIALKAVELADSDKATGHPRAAANFPANEGGKKEESRCQLNVTIKCSLQAPTPEKLYIKAF